MPIRHGGILASRDATCPRDHFCRSTIAPRPVSPTTWNEFLPISIPITAITPLGSSAMGILLSLNASFQLIADSAGARPDHPISGPIDSLAGCQYNRRYFVLEGQNHRIAEERVQRRPAALL